MGGDDGVEVDRSPPLRFVDGSETSSASCLATNSASHRRSPTLRASTIPTLDLVITVMRSSRRASVANISGVSSVEPSSIIKRRKLAIVWRRMLSIDSPIVKAPLNTGSNTSTSCRIVLCNSQWSQTCSTMARGTIELCGFQSPTKACFAERGLGRRFQPRRCRPVNCTCPDCCVEKRPHGFHRNMVHPMRRTGTAAGQLPRVPRQGHRELCRRAAPPAPQCTAARF
jgi:hypothetical protein